MSARIRSDKAHKSLWACSDIDEWESILAIEAASREYSEDSIIYMEGDRTSYLYHLVAGSVKVAMTTADGMEKILAIQEAPSLFGEAAAIDGDRCFSTATALEHCKLRLIPADRLPEIIQRNPNIGMQLMESLVEKMRLLALQVNFLSFLRVPQRVALVLCGLADDMGIVTEDGIELTVRLRHHELANLVGASRVTVTNALNEFKRQGLIDTEGRKIIVRDPDHLAQM